MPRPTIVEKQVEADKAWARESGLEQFMLRLTSSALSARPDDVHEFIASFAQTDLERCVPEPLTPHPPSASQ